MQLVQVLCARSMEVLCHGAHQRMQFLGAGGTMLLPAFATRFGALCQGRCVKGEAGSCLLSAVVKTGSRCAAACDMPALITLL